MIGLTTINIELSSVCNKACPHCGRRKIDKDFPEIKMNYGHMDFALVEQIAKQIPEDIMVQFHWNGEPTLYPNLGKALGLFKHCIRQFDTNGKLIWEKADEIIGNLDVLTVSIMQDDSEFEIYLQKEAVKEFLARKGNRKPRMVYRCLGNVDTAYWENQPGMVVTRTLHKPLMSYGYEKEVTKPEHGICQDMLNHLAIDRFGNVSPCVRLDPKGMNRIGNLDKQSLHDIWYGKKRQDKLELHIDGKRDKIPLCRVCDYWGVPTG